MLRWWHAGLLAAALGALGVLWGAAIEPEIIRVTRLQVALPGARGLEGMRIVHLSDLHLGRAGMITWASIGGGPSGLTARGERLVRILRRLEPHLVLVSGDFLASDEGREAAARLCRAVPPPCGWVAVLGNSDYMLEHESLEKALVQAGVSVLHNQPLRVNFEDGSGLWVVGVDDPYRHRDDVPAALKGLPEGAAPVVALVHSPDAAPELAGRCGLVLAGHTHGGQVRLPLVGPVVTKSRYGKRFVAGLYDLGSTYLYVSRGLGFSGGPPVRIRLNCPPEVVLITLRGAAGAEPYVIR